MAALVSFAASLLMLACGGRGSAGPQAGDGNAPSPFATAAGGYTTAYAGPFGMSLRALEDRTLCLTVPLHISRPTPVTLETCSGDASQQLTGPLQFLNPAAKALVFELDQNGRIQPGAQLLGIDGNSLASTGYSVFSTLIGTGSASNALSFSLGPLQLTCTPSLQAGCRVSATAGFGNVSFFVSEPAHSNGVRLLSSYGTCLTRQSDRVSFSTCSASGVRQLWKTSDHQLESDAGTCILAKDKINAVTLGSCSEATALGRWNVYQGYMTFFAGASKYGTDTYALPSQPADQSVVLSGPFGYTSTLSFGPPEFPQ